MPTIVIVNCDPEFAGQLAADVMAGGFRVMACSTADRSAIDCADLILCEPQLAPSCMSGFDAQPVLLAWAPSATLDAGSLLSIAEGRPGVHIAARRRPDLINQINELLTAQPQLTQFV